MLKTVYMRVARGSFYLGLGQIATLSFEFMRVVLIVRALDQASYGELAIIIATYLIATELLGFRLQEPVTRFMVEYDHRGEIDKVSRLLGVAIAIDGLSKIASAILIILIAPVVITATHMGSENFVLFILMAAVAPLPVFYNVWFSLARHKGKFQSISLVQSSTAALALFITYWMIEYLDDFSLDKAIIALCIAWVYRAVISTYQASRLLIDAFGIKVRSLTPFQALREWNTLVGFKEFLFSGFISSSLVALVRNLDVMILGAIRNVGDVAIYQVAKNLGNLIMQGSGILSIVIYQDFNKMIAKENIKEVVHLIKKVMIFVIPVTILTLIAGIVYSEQAIEFVYGDQYSVSAEVFVVFLAAAMILQVLFWVQPLGLALDCSRIFLVQVLYLTPIGLSMLLALTYFYGIYGTAISISVWLVSSRLLMLEITRRRFKIRASAVR